MSKRQPNDGNEFLGNCYIASFILCVITLAKYADGIKAYHFIIAPFAAIVVFIPVSIVFIVVRMALPPENVNVKIAFFLYLMVFFAILKVMLDLFH